MTHRSSHRLARLLTTGAAAAALSATGPLACGGSDDGGTTPTPPSTQPTQPTPGGDRSQRAVAMRDNFFSPSTDTVAIGGTVTWTNSGNNPHTSTAENRLWDSGRLTAGQTFARQFPQAGSFPYDCTIHPGMTGTIVVR